MEQRDKGMNKNNIHVLSRAVIIDNGHILLCQTVDLPTNFCFLPGGHVEHGESAERAVIRELLEETGSKCIIQRFLGCLEYSFEPGHSSICHNHEYNFIYQIFSETLKFDSEISKLENHIDLVWIPFENLSSIDFRAEPLKMLLTKWLREDYSEAFKSIMV